LNGDTLTALADAFARRVETEAGSDLPGRAIQLALSRAPSAAETSALESFLASQSSRYAESIDQKSKQPVVDRSHARQRALADLCQMLLGSNEFAYVD
jgi:hypothetical protein